MRRRVVLVVGIALLAMPLSTALAASEVTLEGSFIWTRDDGDETGDLRAVFTPRGEGAWEVAFHFDWEGEPHVFAGTALGSLSKGKLKGNVESDQENHKLSFEFQGKVKRGTFTGSHGYFNREGELKPSGTLTLRSQN